MQSQVKIFCCLALFTVLLHPALSNADLSNWELLNREKMQVLEHSSAQGEVITSYIPFFIDIGSQIWGWDPKKQPKNTTVLQGLAPLNSLNEMMSNLFVQFDLADTKHFRKVWFQPTPNLKFRGLLGIHDFQKKRPLVIIRMGIHGNVDEVIAERFLAKAIYEDLNANFLIIESLTSHAFLSNNKNISFGGVEEGLHTFFVLNELNNSHFKKLISSFHLLAISMGGHGTFVTALMDNANNKLIKSIVNFCPLINLQETIDFHTQNGFSATVVDLWNVRRLKALFDIFPKEPELENWWMSLFDLRPRFTQKVLSLVNEKAKKPLLPLEDLNVNTKPLRWPQGFKEHLSNANSLYQLNNFWNYYQNVKTPMTIYTTPNDPLVINNLNSEKIFNDKQVGDFKNLKYERLNKGIHCGIAPVYEWNYIVNLIKQGLSI